MRTPAYCATLLVMLVWFPLYGGAETLYITSELSAGIHAEKTVTSPIIRIVPSGTPLEVIKREDKLAFVKTTDGANGWIDNSYLDQQAPGTASAVSDTLVKLQQAYDELEQQYKSEKVRSGELQVEIAELRKRLGQDNSDDSLYEKIDELSRKNKQLEVQLAKILESPATAGQRLPAVEGTDKTRLTWQNLLIYLGIAIVLGLVLGIYLMDIFNRRRHGGFRI